MTHFIHTGLFFCPQFRYKTRVYKQTNLDEKALAKLSSKVFHLFTKMSLVTDIQSPGPPTGMLFLSPQASQKKFLDYIQTGSLEKMAKVLEKGLDPNFHDPDSGGENPFVSIRQTL